MMQISFPTLFHLPASVATLPCDKQQQPQQVYNNQPGFRQSYSGSETSTDVSLSSTENLATSQRQDPQGEETTPSAMGFHPLDHLGGGSGMVGMLDGVGGIGGGGGYSILERLGMPPSALDGAGKFSSLQQHSSVMAPGGSGTGGGQSYSAYIHERTRRQEEAVSSSSGNPAGVASFAAHAQNLVGADISSYNAALNAHQSSSSPLYSRGHLTVPQHQSWQSSRQAQFSSSTSSPHYITSSLSSIAARHESSISSNSSSSSTLTMISRGGGGVALNNNFSSSTLSYNSSSTNRSNTNDSGEGGNTRHWTVGSGDSTSSGSLSSLVTASSSTSSSRLDLLNSGGATNSNVNNNINNNNNNSNSTGPFSMGGVHSSASPSTPGIIKSSSSTSSSLSHLPSYNSSTGGLPPPPDYPGHLRSEGMTPRSYLTPGGVSADNLRPSRSYETMLEGQASHNDLRGRGGHGRGSQHDLRPCASSPGIYVHDNKLSPATRGAESSSASNVASAEGAPSSGRAASAGSTAVAHMVELLTEENRKLREELAAASVKVAKLHKLEQEIQKVHDSHTALVQSSQKREGLWIAMKRKMEERIQTLEAQSGKGAGPGGVASGSVGAAGSLSGRDSCYCCDDLDGGEDDNGDVGENGCGGDDRSGNPTSSAAEAELRIKLAEKDAMISKLLSQNEELSSNRDQLEATNAQLSLSLAEQRAHVDILENALLNAQSRVLTLEDETRKKSDNAEKVEQLQKALSSLQLVSEKQEKKEKEMRARLEKELEGYRLLEKGNPPKRNEPGKDDSKSAGMLRKLLDEKDARILQLETEIAGMEQRYVKEATLRQLNMESNTSEAPKEVRLAALEKSSSNMEKLIDEAKTEKLKHMEELHQSHRKVAELEAKVKQLQTQVVEKEAMLKVFQRSPLAMARSSSLHALCHHASSHSTVHSPRPSLISSSSTSGIGWTSTTSGTYSVRGGAGESTMASTIRHMKTGSASAIELGRKMSMEEDLLSKVQNLRSESKSDSEEEVKLWHV
ncbi:angiomotin [Elysia marginata]|uniref:Angiomotin n=1 Tax=Elysia marginata TaxID=1093978 RepID=A0AAV4GH68_9GAST|nr:angiomotin [Elysia marginata]